MAFAGNLSFIDRNTALITTTCISIEPESCRKACPLLELRKSSTQKVSSVIWPLFKCENRRGCWPMYRCRSNKAITAFAVCVYRTARVLLVMHGSGFVRRDRLEDRLSISDRSSDSHNFRLKWLFVSQSDNLKAYTNIPFVPECREDRREAWVRLKRCWSTKKPRQKCKGTNGGQHQSQGESQGEGPRWRRWS